MSHLEAINKYKVELISAGITSPETQSSLTRAAYVNALIQLLERHCVPKADHKDVMFHVLNRWNEIVPVNGNIVYGAVNSFYARLAQALSEGGNIFVQLMASDEVNEHPGYSEFATFKELVDVLYGEAEHMYKKIKSV